MVAAVQNGADAVYMGLRRAQRPAQRPEFHGRGFRAAVAYCHLRGVKVYLTLNTLVTDRELPAAAQALQKASDMGGGRHPHPGLGHLAAGPGNCARCSPPRQHPDEPAHPGRGAAGPPSWAWSGWCWPGSCPAGTLPPSAGTVRRSGGVRPRRPVHVLLRPVREPAPSPAACLGGHPLSRRTPTWRTMQDMAVIRTGSRYRRLLDENRGPPPGGVPAAGGRLLPQRLHRRIL